MDTLFVLADLTKCDVIFEGSYLECWNYLTTTLKIALHHGIVILKYSDWVRIKKGVCI